MKCGNKKFMFLLGFICEIALLIVLCIYLNVFTANCEEVEGRVCNNRGVCSSLGICECDVEFSGSACQYTACPGYDPLTGTVCLGNGVCSPFFKREDVPEVCQELRPTAMNGYRRSGPGWGHSKCKALVTEVTQKITLGIYTQRDLIGIPTCACHPPRGGPSCASDVCPKTSDFQVCGGNGNVSVGLVRNDTNSGNGCQCANHVSLLDVITTLGRSEVKLIQERHLQSFKRGFCGTPIWIPQASTFTVIQSPQDVQCFCDEKHYGVACEKGVCPDTAGLTCSGHGHPDFGFGVIRGGNVSGPGCVARCAEGKVLCGSTCDSPGACRAKERKCPPERPFRCANTMCISSIPHCTRGYEFGTYDDIEQMPRYASCIFGTNYRLPQRVACLGESSTVTVAGFVPGGFMQLDSPLIAIRVALKGEGAWSITYRGNTHTRSSPGEWVINYPISEMEHALAAYTNSSRYTVKYEYIPAMDTFHVTPDPLVKGGSIRLYRDGVYRIVNPVRSDTRIGNGEYVMANVTHDNKRILPQACLQNPAICFWRKDSLQSPDGMRNLCRINNAMIAQSSVCQLDIHALLPFTTEVSAILIGSGSRELPDQPIFDDWVVQLPAIAEVRPVMSVTEGVTIHRVEATQVSDVQKPCLCGMAGKNQSLFDAAWFNDASRYQASHVGDHALGVRDVAGFPVYTRGIVASVASDRRVILKFRADELATFDITPKRLTLRESGLGHAYCNQTTHPARCSDSSCSRLELVEVHNVTEKCDCTVVRDGMSCTCIDEFGDDAWYDVVTPPSLDEVCFWEASHAPITNPIGFAPVAIGVWTSQETRTIPISFKIENCSKDFTIPEYVTDRECIDDILHIRIVSQLDFKLTPALRILTERIRPADVVFYRNLGGRSSSAIAGLRIRTSSNSDCAHVTKDTSLAAWHSTYTDHQAFVEVFYPQPSVFTSVYVDILRAGIPSPDDGPHIPVTLMIQGTMEPDAVFEDWVTIQKFSSHVVNSSDIRTIELKGVWRGVRIFSYFPLAIRSFIPFVEQNCTTGILRGTPPNFETLIPLTRTPSTLENCNCNNNCLLNGVAVGNNGLCEDALHFSRPADGVDVCEAGTDCADCGTNVRNHDNSSTCHGDNPTLDSLLLRHTPNYIATIADYVHVSGATLTLAQTLESKTVWRWTKPDCVHECPLHTCTDGSCATSTTFCPPAKYDCKGDGCVRADINNREYKCACDVGRGGLACAYEYCTPGDPETGLIDPHKWCSCNGPSPLKIKPPFTLVWTDSQKNFYTDSEIEAINRPDGRISPMDVGWINIQADKAPYGIAFLRRFNRLNGTFYTNCPYRAKTRYGAFVELEECVARRSMEPPFEVLEWKELADGQIITWEHETQYDDAPYRCPSTGHCVAQERECYLSSIIEPLCGGGGGICRVDGTCKCPAGKITFILTDGMTGKLSIPYKNVLGRTNPTVWGEPNDNRWVGEWCQARNCTEVDCTPSYGCFPGTPSLEFKDRQYECPAPFHVGDCADDIHSCMRGDVTPPLVCSGNGVLKKRDYRMDEWYCECGYYENGILIPNGYGGERCQDYSCQDDRSRIWFARNKPHGLELYTDLNGNPLPGKWMGPCGATIGANPDHIVEWNTCCEGVTQLELCTNIPCIVSGVTKCMDIAECVGVNRKPKVYTCNGKGVALADGTCACTSSQTTGIGYAPDLAVYSTGGCFAKVRCARSMSTGVVCNAKEPCADFDSWSNLPDIDYITQQAYMFAAREGLPISNRSVVMRMLGNELEMVILNIYVQLALHVLTSKRALASNQCVYPFPDNSSMPFGMLPYVGSESVVGPYMKSIAVPYLLQGVVTPFPLLFDGRWFIDPSSEALSTTSAFIRRDAFQTLDFTFARANKVGVIRLHLRTPQPTLLNFGDACQRLSIPAYTSYTWVNIFCVQQFAPYHYDIEDPNGWRANGCVTDRFSATCERWMQSRCTELPGGVVRLPGSLTFFDGCPEGSSRCCIALTEELQPVESFSIFANGTFFIDEVKLYGYAETVVPMPNGLKAIMLANTGQDKCVDEIVFMNPTVGLGGHLSSFHVGIRADFDTASARCQNVGGQLMSPVTEASDNVLASSMGQVCEDPIRGCWVNARDRNEIANPSTTSHVIRPSCTLHGCYLYAVTPGRSIHTAPEVPGDWNRIRWNPGGGVSQVTWTTFFNRLRSRANDQARTVFHSGDWYMRSEYWPVDTGNGVRGFVPPAGESFENYFTLDIKGMTFPPTATFQTIPPPEGGYVDMWTSDKTCTVTVYSTPNCGVWTTMHWTGIKTYARRTGWKKVFRFHAGNYHLFDYNGLGPIRNWLCAQPEVMVNGACVLGKFDDYACTGDECQHVHRNNNPLSDATTLDNLKSFRVEGDCEVHFPGVAGMESPVTGLDGMFHHRTSPGTGAYFYGNEINFNAIFPEVADLATDNPEDGDKWGGLWRDGCYPQIIAGETLGQTDIFQNHAKVPDDPKVTDAPGGVPSDGKYNAMLIYPTFSASLVRFWPMGARTDTNPATDEYEMGYESHVGMCMAVKVERLRTIFPSRPGYPGRTSDTYAVLTDGTAVMPVTPEVNALFAHTDPNCRALNNVPCAITLPFRECYREVVSCTECETPRQSKYEWNQDFFNENSFVTSLSTIYPTAASVTSAVIYPALNVARESITTSVVTNWVLQSLYTTGLSPANIPQLRAYARLSTTIKAADYNVKWWLPYCVKVAASIANPTNFKFIPAICERESMEPVCVRDTYKYTVACGRQCDVCGPCDRIGGVEPGVTAYSRHPDATPQNNPFAHQILADYLSGSLHVQVANLDLVPWDLVYEQINGAKYIFAFPEAVKMFLEGTSTRPGFTSVGAVADPTSWVDMDFARWFPHSCGAVTNPLTGVVNNRCAVSKDFCATYDSIGGIMDKNAMPKWLTGNFTGDLRLEPKCGILIDPMLYDKYTTIGAAQPDNGDFLHTTKGQLKVARANATWKNTGRMSGAPLYDVFTLTGSITTTIKVGMFRIWVGTISPTFATPQTVFYVSDWQRLHETTTHYTVHYTPNITTLQVVGFDFQNLQVGSLLTLSQVLVTTDTTISQCLARTQISYRELPLAVRSYAPKHQCVFTDAMAKKTGVVIGDCACSADSPNGGPGCEWPTVKTTFGGTQICNGFGDDGGYEITRALTRSQVISEHGIYLGPANKYECKCNNPGLMIWSAMVPSSAFGHGFVYRNDKDPNQKDFIRIANDQIPVTISIPVQAANVVDVCRAMSALLPSWNTGDETDALVALNMVPLFVDMKMTAGKLMWFRRNEEFTTLDVSTVNAEPCSGDAALCQALNWNNLAYKTTTNFLTDGMLASSTATGDITVTLTIPTDNVVVEMWVGREETGYVVTTNSGACVIVTSSPTVNIWNCFSPLVSTVTFKRTGTAQIREIRAFSALDSGRVVGYL